MLLARHEHPRHLFPLLPAPPSFFKGFLFLSGKNREFFEKDRRRERWYLERELVERKFDRFVEMEARYRDYEFHKFLIPNEKY